MLFPFLESPLFSEVVSDAMTVDADERTTALSYLHDREDLRVGNSSVLALAVALRLCETVQDQQVLILCYNSIDRY